MRRGAPGQERPSLLVQPGTSDRLPPPPCHSSAPSQGIGQRTPHSPGPWGPENGVGDLKCQRQGLRESPKHKTNAQPPPKEKSRVRILNRKS